MDLVGNVEGCDCIIVDDMIDTAGYFQYKKLNFMQCYICKFVGTLCTAAKHLRDNGARNVYAFASHGIINSLCICSRFILTIKF